MTDYEFGQAVMQAAGCQPEYRQCRVTERDGSVQHYAASAYNELCHVLGTKALVELCDPVWSDPFVDVGFCELWDALEAKEIYPAISSGPGAVLVNCPVMKGNRHEPNIKAAVNRYAALVESAARALGVSRTGGRACSSEQGGCDERSKSDPRH